MSKEQNKSGVAAETAIKIGRFLSTGPEFWMNLQSLYDIEEAKTQYDKAVKAIHPYSHADHPVELAYKQ